MNELEKLLDRAFENKAGKNHYQSGKYEVAFEERTWETLFWVYENGVAVMEGNTLDKEIRFNVRDCDFEKYINAVQNVLADQEFKFVGEIYEEYMGKFKESLLEKCKFKLGDKVKIPYISDCNLHNGQVGVVTWINPYKVYPDGDVNHYEYKYQMKIKYPDGSTTMVNDSNREGSGIVNEIVMVESLEQFKEQLKEALIIEYRGIQFQDFTVDEHGVWGEMCEDCAEKYKDLLSEELDDGGTACGACSVKGCEAVGNDIEKKHYYVDFKPELIKVLEKKEFSLESKVAHAEKESEKLNEGKIIANKEVCIVQRVK